MIFGTGSPKFVYDPEGTPVTVNLDYVVILTDKPEIDLVEHKSVINGHREFILQGKHWVYEIRLHLCKYADIRAKYEEINQYLGADVWLYRHREAAPFKDSAGDEVLFNIVSIDESYFDTPDYKDVLIIRFESKDYVNLTDGTTPAVSLPETIMSGDY